MRILIITGILLSFFQPPNLVINGGFEKPYLNGSLKLSSKDSFWNYLESYDRNDYPWVRLFMNRTNFSDEEMFYTPGNQIPYEGNCYAGITVYDSQTKVREYLIGALQSELEKGRKYRLTFYVSLDDSSRYGINSLGAAVVSHEVAKKNRSQASPYLKIKPVVEHHGQPLKDTANWVSVSGEFLALGGENKIIIGCFRSDAEIIATDNYKKKPRPRDLGIGHSAFYFIDGISLASVD